VRARGRRSGAGGGRAAGHEPPQQNRPGRAETGDRHPRGYRLRLVEAVQTWLAAAEISTGPAYRSVALGGRVGTAALSPYAASLVIKQRIAAIGPGSRAAYSSAAAPRPARQRRGRRASLFKLTEVSRHKSLDTLRGYARRVDLFKEHAGTAFL
jgi:hypothetical protein